MNDQAATLFSNIKSVLDFAPSGFINPHEISIIAFEWVRAANLTISFNNIAQSAIEAYLADKLLGKGFGEDAIAAVADAIYAAWSAIQAGKTAIAA